MATCMEGDSFYLDASVTYDDLPTFDGCYLDSGYTTGDDELILYSRGGFFYYGQPGVLATTYYGTTATWVLVFHDVADDLFYHRCIDADENDATLIHPTEVTQWDCVDGDDFTILDAVTTSCGCTTPSPTLGSSFQEPTPVPLTPTPTPLTAAASLAPSTPTPEPVAPVSPPTPQPAGLSTCGATESFRVMSGSFPEVGGCFQATEESFSNPGGTFEVWSVSGNTNYDQVVVVGLADDGTGETSDSPYSLVYFAEVEDDRIWYCLSNEDAITVHPVDATWQCDISGTGSYVDVTDADISFDCGCITTPSPVGSGSSPIASPATDTTASAPPATDTTTSVPLWGVILGAVGGVALLLVVGFCIGRHRREKERDGNSGNPPPGGSTLPVASQGVGGAGALAGSKSVPAPHPPPPGSGDEPPPPPYSEPPPVYTG
ncbi:unnamed protein product [Scytosiphon promiscuus]